MKKGIIAILLSFMIFFVFSNFIKAVNNNIIEKSVFSNLSKNEQIKVLKDLINDLRIKIEKIIKENEKEKGEFIIKNGLKYYKKQYSKNQKLLYCRVVNPGSDYMKVDNESKNIKISTGNNEWEHIEKRTSKKTQTYLILNGLGVNGEVECLNSKKQTVLEWKIEDFDKKLINNYRFETRLTETSLFVDVYDKRNGEKIQTIEEKKRKFFNNLYTFSSEMYKAEHVGFLSMEEGVSGYEETKGKDWEELFKSINFIRTNNIDLNFDGIQDFFIETSSTMSPIDAYNGIYYIFSQEEQKFIKAEGLTQATLGQIDYNYLKKELAIHTQVGGVSYVFKVLKYDKNGKLIKKESYSDKDYYLGKTFKGYKNIGSKFWIKYNEIYFLGDEIGIIEYANNRDYYNFIQIDIDPEKYKIIDERWAIYDNKNFYIWDEKQEGIDPNKVKYLGNDYWLYNNEDVYYRNFNGGNYINIENIEKIEFIDKDKDMMTDGYRVYQNGKKLENTNYECYKKRQSVKDINGNKTNYIKDCRNIYEDNDYYLRRLDIDDVDNFEVFSNGYITDGKKIFNWYGEIIKNTDYECYKELKVLKEPRGNNSNYSKDCRNVYYKDNIMVIQNKDSGFKPDYKTFIVDDKYRAHDKRDYYRGGFLDENEYE